MITDSVKELYRERYRRFRLEYPELFPIPSDPQPEQFGLNDTDLRIWAHITREELALIEPVSRFWLLAESMDSKKKWEKENKKNKSRKKITVYVDDDFLAEIVTRDIQAENDVISLNYSFTI